ncbi:MAG: hypothetical protein IJG84_11040 [Kiritimatiellae bacterium]|nr:hypothetical protein [Kiritimatiellia bacterium]
MPGRKPAEPKAGEKHNMLTFIEPAGREPSGKMGERVIYTTLGKWQCDCGNVVICRNRYVLSGKKKSCGCLLRATGESWRKGRRVERHPNPDSPIDNLAAAIRELATAIMTIRKDDDNGKNSTR